MQWPTTIPADAPAIEGLIPVYGFEDGTWIYRPLHVHALDFLSQDGNYIWARFVATDEEILFVIASHGKPLFCFGWNVAFGKANVMSRHHPSRRRLGSTVVYHVQGERESEGDPPGVDVGYLVDFTEFLFGEDAVWNEMWKDLIIPTFVDDRVWVRAEELLPGYEPFLSGPRRNHRMDTYDKVREEATAYAYQYLSKVFEDVLLAPLEEVEWEEGPALKVTFQDTSSIIFQVGFFPGGAIDWLAWSHEGDSHYADSFPELWDKLCSVKNGGFGGWPEIKRLSEQEAWYEDHVPEGFPVLYPDQNELYMLLDEHLPISWVHSRFARWLEEMGS
jgi:hypothetical protein